MQPACPPKAEHQCARLSNQLARPGVGICPGAFPVSDIDPYRGMIQQAAHSRVFAIRSIRHWIRPSGNSPRHDAHRLQPARSPRSGRLCDCVMGNSRACVLFDSVAADLCRQRAPAHGPPMPYYNDGLGPFSDGPPGPSQPAAPQEPGRPAIKWVATTPPCRRPQLDAPPCSKLLLVLANMATARSTPLVMV